MSEVPDVGTMRTTEERTRGTTITLTNLKGGFTMQGIHYSSLISTKGCYVPWCDQYGSSQGQV